MLALTTIIQPAVKLNQTGLNMKPVSCKLKGSKTRARPMQDEIPVPKRRRYHLTENHDEVFSIPPSLGIYILRLETSFLKTDPIL